ncbi:phospholipase A1 member A-like [Chelonus insularis]|uniref:phospholipase A1 member A-like n=1 Tax=Chelonus insularis TaxID=460826 RepID=UPI001588A5EF|nr:phospholipase A1 member A-like [Chelonus insularis]
MRKQLNVVFLFVMLFRGHNAGITEELARFAKGPIQDAIESGMASEFNKDECLWRRNDNRDPCPDPDIHIYLYTPGKPKKELIGKPSDWLMIDYDHNKDNIILIHGYAGGDDTLPVSVLRDAYMNNGSYNVFLIDWSALSAAPCYPAAVANLKPVAKCLAHSLTILQHLGMTISKTTCVGHSLGAHLCGIIANYLLFRMHKIIGLDPARPLVRPALGNRLDSGDANFVEVIHTNAGYYGEIGQIGHVDICVNGGKVQPFCENKPNYQLCSHVWSVCYMAQSIDGQQTLVAEPCSRRCPSGPRINTRTGQDLIVGQHTPSGSRGSFCLTSHKPPYCPQNSENGKGDPRCCIQ